MICHLNQVLRCAGHPLTDEFFLIGDHLLNWRLSNRVSWLRRLGFKFLNSRSDRTLLHRHKCYWLLHRVHIIFIVFQIAKTLYSSKQLSSYRIRLLACLLFGRLDLPLYGNLGLLLRTGHFNRARQILASLVDRFDLTLFENLAVSWLLLSTVIVDIHSHMAYVHTRFLLRGLCLINDTRRL